MYLIVAGHCEILPLHKVVLLAQVAKTYHRLTADRLLDWRALKVVLTRRPGALSPQTLGAMEPSSWYTRALASPLFMLYKHFHVSQASLPSVARRLAGSLDEDDSSPEGERSG